jgi:hypothetical protein
MHVRSLCEVTGFATSPRKIVRYVSVGSLPIVSIAARLDDGAVHRNQTVSQSTAACVAVDPGVRPVSSPGSTVASSMVPLVVVPAVRTWALARLSFAGAGTPIS